MSEELKPCAHCCGKAEFRSDGDEYSLDGKLPYWVCCTECSINSGCYSDPYFAIDSWNTRASPWVSVGDGLPEHGQQVLVKSRFGVFIDEWDYFHESPVNWSSETIVTGEGWQDNDAEDVTHWMPIPEPPEVG